MEDPTPSFTFKVPPAMVKAQGILEFTIAPLNGGAAGPEAHVSARLDLARRRRVRQWADGSMDDLTKLRGAEQEAPKEGPPGYVQPCVPLPLEAPPRRLDVWQPGPEQGAAAGPLTLFVWPPYLTPPQEAAAAAAGEGATSGNGEASGLRGSPQTIPETWEPSACVAAYVIKATDPTTGQVIASQTVATMNPLDARTRVELQPGSPLADALHKLTGPAARPLVLSAAACGRLDLASGSPRDCGPTLTLPPATLITAPSGELRLCSAVIPVREPELRFEFNTERLTVTASQRDMSVPLHYDIRGHADIDCITSFDAALLDPGTKAPLAGCAPEVTRHFDSPRVGDHEQVERWFNCTDALAGLVKAGGAPKRVLLRTVARREPLAGAVQEALLRVVAAPSPYAIGNSPRLVVCEEARLDRPFLRSIARATAGQSVVDAKSGELVSQANGDIVVNMQRSGSDKRRSACIDLYNVVVVPVAPSAGAPRSVMLRLVDPTEWSPQITIKGGGPPGARFYVNITAVSPLYGSSPTLQTAVVEVPLSTAIVRSRQDDVLLENKPEGVLIVFASVTSKGVRPFAVREKLTAKLYQRPAAACSGSLC